MTAENSACRAGSASPIPRFNEAAADDRGKPRRRSARSASTWDGFNEAAADDRGKLAHRRDGLVLDPGASMRPRPMTAENTSRPAPVGSRNGVSLQ